MAVITPSSFDPLKTRCNVRLQQGVPIVDADWNELDDIRKFEMRAFVKWFVGDGIPEGNDGFRIEAIGAADDFVIRAGGSAPAGGANNTDIALRNIGRCVVDGLDVIIQSDVNFKAQPAPVGAPAITPIPVVTGPVTVYLDVWERLVTFQDEPSLVLPGLGTESCARVKRSFCVRARTGSTAPISGESDFATGHVYYALATIDRRLSAPNIAAPITAADVTDRRERRLLTVPAPIIADVFGVSASDYRRGAGRPAMSLRDAINALLRGDLPGSPETVIAADPNQDFMTYGLTFEPDSSATVVWHSNRIGGGANNQLFGARWDAGNPAAGFSPAVPITTGPAVHAAPHSVLLPTGELIAAYTAGPAGAEAAVFKRGAGISGLAASAEFPIASAAGDAKRHPLAVVTGTLAGGGIVVFFWHETLPAARWAFRRRQYTSSWAEADAKWLDAAGVQLPMVTPPTPANEAGGGVHAVADTTGAVWFVSAQLQPTAINVVRLIVATGTFTNAQVTASATGGTAGDFEPFVLFDSANAAWVIWLAPGIGVMAQRFQPGSLTLDGAPVLLPGTESTFGGGISRGSPSAAVDSSGAIWVFFITSGPSTVPPFQVFAIRRDPVTQAWGAVRKITGSTGSDSHSRTFVATAPNGVLWGLFKRQTGSTNDLFYKQIVTSI